jgi:hypothetical protein
MVDDDGFQDSCDDREIWEVTHVCEEELETNESEGVDFLAELLELVMVTGQRRGDGEGLVLYIHKKCERSKEVRRRFHTLQTTHRPCYSQDKSDKLISWRHPE